MADPIYKINFAVKHPEEEGAVPSVTPTAAQPAGYYGDDNFALVTFTMDSVVNGHRYRIEIVDGSGAYDISELLDAKNKVISYTIPRKWTAAGTATLQLVEIEMGADGTEKAVAHYPPARISFEARDDSAPMGDVLPAWQEVMTKAETVTNTVYEAYASGALHGRSGVYVGTGDMPADCNVQVIPTGSVLWADEQINAAFKGLAESVAVHDVEITQLKTHLNEEVITTSDSESAELAIQEKYKALPDKTFARYCVSINGSYAFFELFKAVNGWGHMEKIQYDKRWYCSVCGKTPEETTITYTFGNWTQFAPVQ